MNKDIKLLLIDDHAILREGYVKLFEASGYIVCGQGSNADEGYSLFTETRPDITLLDMTMPGASGLECLRRIKARDPEAKIIVCTMHDNTTLAKRAIQAGASGYVTKSSSSMVLLNAIRAVAENGMYLGADIAQAIAFEKSDDLDNRIKSLSHQEYAVFRMVTEGKTISETANVLSLSPKTVSNYKANMMRKLGANNLADLIMLARDHGLQISPV